MKLLVIDGNSIFNRAFYGVKMLTTKDGKYTNAIYGFLTMLNKITDETSPDRIAIAFDKKGPTFRHKMYAGYKAKRKGMPEELAPQFPVLKDLLKLLGYQLVECEGFEADDILGTFAKKCDETHDQCIIATGDRDILQLVSDNVSVRIISTKFGKSVITTYDEDTVKEKYMLTPKQLIELKAIQGDTSDNIPGVPGIGEKGASELIQRFGTLDSVYENIDSSDIKECMRKKLLAGKDSAYMSRVLGTIRTDVPIDTDLDKYQKSEMKNEAIDLMNELEFFSLIERMGLEKKLDEDAQLFDDDTFMVDGKVYKLDKSEEILNLLKDPSKEKQAHDCKRVFAFGLENGIEVSGISFGIKLAAYILNPDEKDFSAKRFFLLYDVKSFAELVAKMKDELIERDQLELLQQMEIPFAKVLAQMERVGFEVDRQGICDYGDSMVQRIEALQSDIFSSAGVEFNINSPKQLGEVLFERLGLPTGKKTKRGYSTSADVLENLRYTYPIVEDILSYRSLTKLKSTYCDGLLKVIDSDGRVRSTFNQTETRTGRISSSEPNLQNIPVRTELGREMRKFFVAKKGYVLVDADYSQIELRILACMSQDEDMLEAFRKRSDIHLDTASKVFQVPYQMVTPLMRTRAKAVNFGIVYGIGAFSLSKDIGVTRREAQNYIDSYFDHYKRVKVYLDEVVKSAYDSGYAQTLFKRRRYLPQLQSSNFNLRAFGERVAKNMPIQGTAADIIKLAMIKIGKRLAAEEPKANIILQVHDEIIVEVPESSSDRVKDILKEEMQNTVNLPIPLEVDVGIGKTWYNAKN